MIPLYNGAAYVADAIEAILAQSKPAAEIIVVDDCSTDDGAPLAERYRDRATILSTAQNSGVQIARNLGIAHARTEWMALCDQDDIWGPTYLARLSDLLDSEPEVEFTLGNFRTTRHGAAMPGTKFDSAPKDYWESAGRRVVPHGWVFDRSLGGRTLRWQPIFPSVMSFSKRLIAKVGASDPAMRGSRPEDSEFSRRGLYHACVGVLPEALVTIRRHQANFSGDPLLTQIDEVKLLQWIRQNHAEARQYLGIVDDEIRRRRIVAVHGAFAARRHDLLRTLLAEVAPEDRSLRLRIKGAIAALPDAIGLTLNRVLQTASAHETVSCRRHRRMPSGCVHGPARRTPCGTEAGTASAGVPAIRKGLPP